MYRVCTERNVPAAFECFFGPDSGNVERFALDRRTRRMRAQSWRARLDRTLALARTSRHFIFSFSRPIALPK